MKRHMEIVHNHFIHLTKPPKPPESKENHDNITEKFVKSRPNQRGSDSNPISTIKLVEDKEASSRRTASANHLFDELKMKSRVENHLNSRKRSCDFCSRTFGLKATLSYHKLNCEKRRKLYRNPGGEGQEVEICYFK